MLSRCRFVVCRGEPGSAFKQPNDENRMKCRAAFPGMRPRSTQWASTFCVRGRLITLFQQTGAKRIEQHAGTGMEELCMSMRVSRVLRACPKPESAWSSDQQKLGSRSMRFECTSAESRRSTCVCVCVCVLTVCLCVSSASEFFEQRSNEM